MEIIEIITNFGPMAGIATCVVFYFVSDKSRNSKYPIGKIKVKEDDFSLKDGSIAKAGFVIKCWMDYKDKEDKTNKVYDVTKLSGAAAIMFRSVLSQKTPKEIKANIGQVEKEILKQFLLFEGKHNNPRQIVSAKIKITSFEIARVEKIR